MNDLRILVTDSSDEAVVRFADSLGCAQMRYVRIDPPAFARAQNCYPNVDFVVSKHGGQRIDGWAVWNYEGFFLEAEHHAVWKSPSGAMRCVTPQPEVDDTDQILFCFGGAPKYERARIEMRRQILQRSREVSFYISCMDCLNRRRHELADAGVPMREMMLDSKLILALDDAESALAELRK